VGFRGGMQKAGQLGIHVPLISQLRTLGRNPPLARSITTESRPIRNLCRCYCTAKRGVSGRLPQQREQAATITASARPSSAITTARVSVVGVSQPILYSVFDFASLVFSLFPNRLAVVTVKFIRVECQKGANQNCKNYYDCRPH
jgi:hypothetical protein